MELLEQKDYDVKQTAMMESNETLSKQCTKSKRRIEASCKNDQTSI
jgi:hypothetical protein